MKPERVDEEITTRWLLAELISDGVCLGLGGKGACRVGDLIGLEIEGFFEKGVGEFDPDEV